MVNIKGVLSYIKRYRMMRVTVTTCFIVAMGESHTWCLTAVKASLVHFRSVVAEIESLSYF